MYIIIVIIIIIIIIIIIKQRSIHNKTKTNKKM